MISYGWQREEREVRSDYKENNDRVRSLSERLFVKAKIWELSNAERKTRVDNLQQYFPPVYDQGTMFSCTANAAAFALEFYTLLMRGLPYEEAAKYNQYRPLSRLFIYYNARRLMNQWMFENGTSIRATLGALKLFGAPYENFWPYDPAKFWIQPDPFVYSLASANKVDVYVLHEYNDRERIIDQVKRYLAAGVPSVCGFQVFESRDDNFSRKPSNKKKEAEERREIAGTFPLPYNDPEHPDRNEKMIDRHVIAIVGYDDDVEIVNRLHNQVKTRGAFKIRNSWGTSWGEDGYGWLPYDYVRKDLAYNFWSLLWLQFIETDNFDIKLDHVTIPGRS